MWPDFVRRKKSGIENNRAELFAQTNKVMLFSVNNTTAMATTAATAAIAAEVKKKKLIHILAHTFETKRKRKNNVSYATNYTLLIRSIHHSVCVCAILLVSNNMMKRRIKV